MPEIDVHRESEDELEGRSRRVDEVGRPGIYPSSGPRPRGGVELRGQGELGHREERGRLALPAVPHTVPALLGRLLLGGYFVYNGVNHFVNRGAMSQYASSKGVPAASWAVPGSGLLALLGGLSLVTGVRPKVGSSLIAAFLLGVSPQMHAFWKETDPGRRRAELVNFTKNISLIGGAMFAAGLPEPWPYSFGAFSGAGR